MSSKPTAAFALAGATTVVLVAGAAAATDEEPGAEPYASGYSIEEGRTELGVFDHCR